jgi:hypothetical protein
MKVTRLVRMLTPIGISTIVAGTLVIAPATAAVAGSGTTRDVSASGTASFYSAPAGVDGLAAKEFRSPGTDASAAPAAGPVVNRSQSAGKDHEGSNGDQSSGDHTNAQLAASFDGLTFRQQRLANGGNQFSVEPPDQGLCVGNGFILETVNTVMNVYNTNGHSLLGVTDLNTFYHYPAQFDRGAGLIGPFLTDPSCYFDSQTNRWFHVVLTLDQDLAGNFLGTNHLDLAISKTSSPLGGWTVYKVDTTNDGTNGTPNHHCPTATGANPDHPNACFADYPHIGADRNGFYVTTNEYPFWPPTGYISADIYAFSKAALAANKPKVAVTLLDTVGADRGNPGFTLWPSESPDRQFASSGHGTEYFMSSNAADEANGTHVSNDLLVWTLSNTRSLGSSSPAIHLSNTVVHVETYAVPARSQQKAGNFPLGQCINDTTAPTPFGPGCWQYLFVSEPSHTEVETRLDSNDTRMQQVTYANGKLWGALDTAITVGGANQAGIAWFIVDPRGGEEGSSAELLNQGYLAVAGNNVIYPAIGVTGSGKGVMAFTLVGQDHFPSAAYATIGEDGVGDVHVAAEGAGPQDGFTSYKAEVGDPPRPRWGDYGAAVPVGNSVWIASEYIGQTCTLAQYMTNTASSPLFSCGRTRTALGNWDTRISLINLGD